MTILNQGCGVHKNKKVGNIDLDCRVVLILADCTPRQLILKSVEVFFSLKKIS